MSDDERFNSEFISLEEWIRALAREEIKKAKAEEERLNLYSPSSTRPIRDARWEGVYARVGPDELFPERRSLTMRLDLGSGETLWQKAFLDDEKWQDTEFGLTCFRELCDMMVETMDENLRIAFMKGV